MPRGRKKRTYTQAPVAIDQGVPCSHCKARYGHKVTHTFPNGNRRRVCGECGKAFISKRMIQSSIVDDKAACTPA